MRFSFFKNMSVKFKYFQATGFSSQSLQCLKHSWLDCSRTADNHDQPGSVFCWNMLSNWTTDVCSVNCSESSDVTPCLCRYSLDEVEHGLIRNAPHPTTGQT